jgi:diketogulonate reductase-like aldo/keto reductase
MRTENFQGLHFPKIGFGTWRIGGRNTADPSVDAQSLAALRSALELGYTHIDTAESYAAGHCEELVGRAVRESGIRREGLFITSKVSPEHLSPASVRKSCENSLRRLGMDYLDLYLIHWPSPGMKLPETFSALNQLVREGKIRHLGVSNFDLAQLKESAALSETPLFTDQVPYSIVEREYVENGVLAYCQQNDILLTAYSPIKNQDFSTHARLQRVAQAHGLNAYQAAMAWLTTQPRVITIPMSFSRQHQAENLAAGDVVLSADEMELLTK